MVRPRINLKGMEIDAAGGAAVTALLLAGYLLLIRSPLHDALAGSDLEVRQAQTTQAILSLRKEFSRNSIQIEDTRKLLLTKASWLTHSDLPDEVLARINELARQCEVRISRWQPQGQQAFAEYRVQSFAVEGVASWPALLRWFALIEEGVPLLDVTHFSVAGPRAPARIGCEFSCSLKLYLGADDAVLEVATTRQ